MGEQLSCITPREQVPEPVRLPARLQIPGHMRKHSDSVEVFTWKYRPHCDMYSLINELFPALGQPEPETMSDLR